MDIELKKKIVYLTDTSLLKINLKVTDDQEFINQFSYKYNIRIFKDEKLFLKSVYTHKKAKPIDLYISDNKISKRHNDMFLKLYGTKKSQKVYEGTEEVKKILQLKDYQNGGKHGLLNQLLYNEFNLKMSLEELSENEKIIYSKPYAYGPVNYFNGNRPLHDIKSYDINSEHPYHLCNDDLLVPMRRGKESLIKDIKDIDVSKVGLYLVTIEFNKMTKYFKPITPKTFFTVSNYFIKVLNETKTPYAMYINPEMPINSVVYENDDCINLNSIIGFKIKKLYERKQNGCGLSKKLLHLILGKFSQRFADTEPISSPEERIKYNSCFITTPNIFFRFKNFIYDICRVNLFNKYIKYCHENRMKIYRIKADCIHISGFLPDDMVSSEMGCVKYEGSYTLEEGLLNISDTSYKNVLTK